MYKKIIAAVALAAITSATAFAGPYEDGIAAFDRGEYAKAAAFFQKAADKGLALAQLRLGIAYKEGTGLAQNYAAAAKWLNKAAVQGNMHAQYELGTLYHEGKGVAKNTRLAAQWWRKAALQGIAPAQYRLARLYNAGQGVQRNVVHAHMWYHLAAIGGQKKACDERDAVATRMTPEQLAESARLARKWLIGEGV